MKKTLIILALALALLALPACKVNVVLGDIAQQLQAANAGEEAAQADIPGSADGDSGQEAASPADAAPDEGAPEEAIETSETPDDGDAREEDAASASDAGEQTPDEERPEQILENAADLAALDLSQLVTDADGAAGQLPRILADCPGAAWINDDIEGSFRYLVDADYCVLWYDAYKNGNYLTLLIAQNYDGGSSFYTPYTLDLSSGQRLTGSELLTRLGAEPSVLGDAELSLMEEEFQTMFGAAQDDGDLAAFYEEQHQRTISTDNAEFERVWLGHGGELYFAAKIYSLAGPEFLEYPLATGLYY